MKKRLITVLVLMLAIFVATTAGVLAASQINLVVNGKAITDVEAKLIDGSTYVPLRAVSEMLGAEVGWDSETKTAYVNLDQSASVEVETDPISESEPEAVPIVDDSEPTEANIANFLGDEFSTLNTAAGITAFDFTVSENTSIRNPYDFRISTVFDLSFFLEVQTSNKLTSGEREEAENDLKEHQKNMAEALFEKYPDIKFSGGYSYSWYRYPSIQSGFESRNYFTWTNYAQPGGYDIVEDEYNAAEIGDFRWFDFIDDEF